MLHDHFILTADAVCHLSQSDANVSRVSTRNDDNSDDDNCDTAAAFLNADHADVTMTSVGDDGNNVGLYRPTCRHRRTSAENWEARCEARRAEDRGPYGPVVTDVSRRHG